MVLLSLLSDALKHRHAIGFWPITIGKSAEKFLETVSSLTRERHETGMFLLYVVFGTAARVWRPRGEQIRTVRGAEWTDEQEDTNI